MSAKALAVGGGLQALKTAPILCDTAWPVCTACRSAANKEEVLNVSRHQINMLSKADPGMGAQQCRIGGKLSKHLDHEYSSLLGCIAHHVSLLLACRKINKRARLDGLIRFILFYSFYSSDKISYLRSGAEIRCPIGWRLTG